MTVLDEGKFSAVLSEFAATLASDFPLNAILDHLVERIVDLLPISAAGFTLISTVEAPRYIAASDESARCFEQLQTDLDQGPCIAAYDSGSPVLIPDLRVAEGYASFAPAAVAAGLLAVFAFPLVHGGGRFGALDLYRGSPGGLSTREIEVAATLANVASAYLMNARARDRAQRASDQFRHHAFHDVLTGLPNRLLLQERLLHAAARATRSHTPAAVLFVDLDGFKAVNDRHGHRVGDQLLCAVATRLAHGLRAGDTLARVGGDEFVLVCEDLSDVADAQLIADRIRNSFAAQFVLADAEISISASVGIAYSGPGDAVSEHLVADADAAMYKAKRGQRECERPVSRRS
jgi:diguanylate cyclase (GGDEF)-like protein